MATQQTIEQLSLRTYDVWSMPSSWEDVYNFISTFNGRHQPIIHDYPWTFPVIAVPLYLIMVFYGPKLMKNREPFDLRWAMILWNFGLASLSCFMFWGMVGPVFSFVYHRGFYELICMPYGELYIGPPFFCIWLFALSKYAELFDTAFHILRKRTVIFLHWYHHTTVLVYTWFSLVILTPPGAIFGVVNAGVHCIMYYYYFLHACGRRPNWGILVTIVQLSQMVVGIGTASTWSYYYLTGVLCPMDHPNAYMLSSIVLYGSYFALFLQFFINRYMNPSKPSQASKSAPSKVKKDN